MTSSTSTVIVPAYVRVVGVDVQVGTFTFSSDPGSRPVYDLDHESIEHARRVVFDVLGASERDA